MLIILYFVCIISRLLSFVLYLLALSIVSSESPLLILIDVSAAGVPPSYILISIFFCKSKSIISKLPSNKEIRGSTT